MNNAIHNLKQFIIAGKAIFTVLNTDTGNRFTYKVTKMNNKDGSVVHFVAVLTGMCNTTNYSYIGLIQPTGVFAWTKGSSVHKSTLSFKAFSWLWENVSSQLPATVEVRHEGRCGRCGKRLTTPKSIDQGFGPECIQHIE